MNKRFLFILLCGMVVLVSCERDDICSATTPTTPKAIVTFYDVANQESLKSVQGLRVIGEGQESPVSTLNVVTTDSIAIPLRTNMNSTTFVFHKNYTIDDNDTPDDDSDDIIGGNPDTLTITYDPEEIYVSRACGFKTVFRNFSIVLEDDGDNWIQTFTNVSDNLTIENEEQAHINITH
jgi:hypothetical protein